MANKRNYQRELENIIAKNNGNKKKLLIHSCCAPCSSYCLEYLHNYFEITVLYYNPNITEASEYNMRIKEQKRLIHCLNERFATNIKLIEANYDTSRFLKAVKGYEDCPEGGDRCKICFALRLDEAAKTAKDFSFDYFTTSLTISPLKNADILNEIGEKSGEKYNISFLPSDFKKKNGYKRSIELSREYDLYRQDYCGCIFSKNNKNDNYKNDYNKNDDNKNTIF